jgi:tRNA (cytidine/uridine-2'-O-)-methyltransferase
VSQGDGALLSAGPRLHIALVEPEIPQNTGNIGRLCVGLGARLHLVRPLGFSLDEKAVRRAGIDHWHKVDLAVHEDLQAFLDWANGRRVLAFSRHAERSFTQVAYQRGDVLVFGKESVGLPDGLRARFECFRIPIPGPIRSLNLANAVSIVGCRALEALEPELFSR